MQRGSWEAMTAKNKSDTWINDVPGESRLLLLRGRLTPPRRDTSATRNGNRNRNCRQKGVWLQTFSSGPLTNLRAVYNNITYSMQCDCKPSYSPTGQRFYNFHTENVIKLWHKILVTTLNFVFFPCCLVFSLEKRSFVIPVADNVAVYSCLTLSDFLSVDNVLQFHAASAETLWLHYGVYFKGVRALQQAWVTETLL